MKRLLIFSFTLIFGYIHAQVIISSDVDVSEYPLVSFSLHHPNPDVSENSIQIHQIINNQSILAKDLDVKFSDDINLVIPENKCVLILFELTFNKQRIEQINTFHSSLQSVLPKIVKKGDEVKICTFSLRDANSVLLNEVNKNFTDKHELLLRGLKNLNVKETAFTNKNTSDIYASLQDGLEMINNHSSNLPKSIIILSEERNNTFSPENNSDNVIQLARSSKVSINTIKYNRSKFETYADPKLSKSTYGLGYLLSPSDGSMLSVNRKKKKEISKHISEIFNSIPLRSLGKSLDISVVLNDSLLDGKSRIIEITSSDIEKPKKISFKAKGNFIYASFQRYFWIALSTSVIIILLIVYIFYHLFIFFKTKKNERKRKDKELKELQLQQNDQIAGQKQEIQLLKEKEAKVEQEIENLKEAKSLDNKTDSLIKEMLNQGQLPILKYSDSANKEDFIIDKPILWIGRNEDNDIVISNNNYSKKHFSIFFKKGKYYFKDNNSTNGLILNGRKLSTGELENGDIIEIARTKFTFIK